MQQHNGLKGKKPSERYIIYGLKVSNYVFQALTCHSTGSADAVTSPATLFRNDGFVSAYVLERYNKEDGE